MNAAAPADPGNTPPDRGLSDAFGVAAASSLRHAAPRRARAVEKTTSPADKPTEVEGRSSEPEAVEVDTFDPGHSGAAPPAAKAPRFEAGGPAPIALRQQHRASHGRFRPCKSVTAGSSTDFSWRLRKIPRPAAT
jgi:hypothetical protein